jgi:thiol-disulfide isomerase/thioredoxin
MAALRRIIAAVLLVSALPISAAETLAPGAKFPDLSAVGLEGALPELGDARVIIVDFWASWCGPCKQSFPAYDELLREYGPKGVRIIAVNVDRKTSDMEKFLRQRPVKFSVVRDAQQKLVAQVAVPTMPTAFVLDRNGVVRFVHHGFHGERSRMEYTRQLDALLSENP